MYLYTLTILLVNRDNILAVIFGLLQGQKKYVRLALQMAKTREIDKHIIKALEDLKQPLILKDNVRVIFAEKGRKETRFEHIADKKHRLKVSDIEMLPDILRNSTLISRSKKKDHSIIYYGKRKGRKKPPYLKVVIDFRKERLGKIVTIYTVKRAGA